MTRGQRRDARNPSKNKCVVETREEEANIIQGKSGHVAEKGGEEETTALHTASMESSRSTRRNGHKG